MNPSDNILPAIEAEFAGIELGDPRRSARAMAIVGAMAKGPALTLPQLFPDRSELEVAYRFFGNEAVTPAACLKPHFKATVQRVAEHPTFLVAHDTTTFSFGGEARSNLGYVGAETIGFFAHASIAVTADAARTPLGTLAFNPFARKAKAKGKRGKKSPKEPKESLRWQKAVVEVVERLGPLASRAIHVMDREADSYELLAYLISNSIRFVIRLNYVRVVKGDPEGDVTLPPQKITAAVARAEDLLERVVTINRRGTKGRSGKARKTHPERTERNAKLKVRGATVTIQRPVGASEDLPAQLTLNVIEVHEVDVPEGQPPVDWRLLTTEPIDTPEALATGVDCYRGRWRIEEFFKAIKSGCSFEKRQLTDEDSLRTLLSMTVPIAWHLLTIRSLAHSHPTAPAATALRPMQLLLLATLSRRVVLGPNPTLREALLAIAGLGGHLKNNGEPGWQTLGRGFQLLCAAEAAVLAWEARKDESKV